MCSQTQELIINNNGNIIESILLPLLLLMSND